MTDTTTPLRNGTVTAPPQPCCPVCNATLSPGRSKRYCSDRCRQTGWRRRNQAGQPPEPPPPPEPRSRRTNTIYECPVCDGRYLEEQRCPDCNTFCVRLGRGGTCPGCDDLITIDELLLGGPS